MPVVPVVRDGKVEKLLKLHRLFGLRSGLVFQIRAVEMRRVGNVGGDLFWWSLVSHDSHKQEKKACGRRGLYVKSASGGAWGEGLGRTFHPQRTRLPQVAHRG